MKKLLSMLSLVCALTHFTVEAAEPQLDGTSRSPNILVIVTDDQGYADLSAFKHHAPDVHTPNMDRLAARGILFTEAYTTAPVCSPSRAGWNTGQHQVRWDPASSFNCGLPDDTTTMAELLKVNGYATARVGKSDYSNKGIHRQDTSEYPLNHGYDEFLGFCAHGFDYFLLTEEIEARTPDPRGHSASVGSLMHNRGRKEFKEGYLTEIFTDEAIDFLVELCLFFGRNRDEPSGFFRFHCRHRIGRRVAPLRARRLQQIGRALGSARADLACQRKPAHRRQLAALLRRFEESDRVGRIAACESGASTCW